MTCQCQLLSADEFEAMTKKLYAAAIESAYNFGSKNADWRNISKSLEIALDLIQNRSGN